MAEESWYACPCCAKEFYYSPRRDQHIIEDHLKPDPVWSSLTAARMVRCWCGRVTTNGEDFQAHCAQNGGVVQHYIACLLGID